MVPVHARGVADLLKVLLNPRLMMVWAIAGGAAIRGVRQRRWRSRREERRREAEEIRRRAAADLDDDGGES